MFVLSTNNIIFTYILLALKLNVVVSFKEYSYYFFRTGDEERGKCNKCKNDIMGVTLIFR